MNSQNPNETLLIEQHYDKINWSSLKDDVSIWKIFTHSTILTPITGNKRLRDESYEELYKDEEVLLQITGNKRLFSEIN